MDVSRFIKLCVTNDPIQNIIPKLYNSLDKQSDAYIKMCELIANYDKMPTLKFGNKCEMIMVDLHKTITNFTIKFPNNSLKCLKEMLILKIPHLTNQLVGSELALDTDFNMTEAFVKLLYLPNSYILNSNNYIGIFILMQKWSMVAHYGLMVRYLMADNNLNLIIKYHYENDECNDLKFLQDILTNVASIPNVDMNTLGLVHLKSMRRDAYNLTNAITTTVGNFDVLTIISKEMNIRCPKELLKRIPYFKIMIDDNVVQNEIKLEISLEMTKLIIDLLYFPTDKSIIKPENCIQLFDILNQWLMEDYFDSMLTFLENRQNVVGIIKHELKQNKCESLKTLHVILESIASLHFIKNNEFSFKKYDGIKKRASEILNNIFAMLGDFDNFGADILNFDNWQKLFSDAQKMKAINLIKRYELLNIAEMKEVGIVLKFLTENDLASNIYSDVANIKNDVCFKFQYYKLVPPTQVNSFAVITEYYPKFTYHSFDKLPLTMQKLDRKDITLRFDKLSPKLLVGSKIAIGNILLSSDIKHVIVSIKKCFNDIKCDIDSAYFSEVSNMTYEITLDTVVSHDRTTFSPIWLCTENNHLVCL